MSTIKGKMLARYMAKHHISIDALSNGTGIDHYYIKHKLLTAEYMKEKTKSALRNFFGVTTDEQLIALFHTDMKGTSKQSKLPQPEQTSTSLKSVLKAMGFQLIDRNEISMTYVNKYLDTAFPGRRGMEFLIYPIDEDGNKLRDTDIIAELTTDMITAVKKSAEAAIEDKASMDVAQFLTSLAKVVR